MKALFHIERRAARARFLAGLACAGLAGMLAAAPAAAQEDGWKPEKPIRLIVPYAPGGGTDVLARLVFSKVGDSLGQPVVVENRPGANGIIGTNLAYESKPDGMTLLFAAADFISVAPHIYKKVVKFDPDGFAAVAPAAKMGFVLSRQKKGDFKDLSDIVAKSKAGHYTYGHWGPGSMAQMGMELLKAKAGIGNDSMQEIPYTGAAPVMNAVMGGQVDFGFVPTPLAMASGSRLDLFALGSPARFPGLPNVPTLKEEGYDIDADTWFGVLAPPGTPQAAVEAIRRQVARVIADPAVQRSLTEMGYVPATFPPEEFAAFIKAENARWGEVVRNAGIKVEE